MEALLDPTELRRCIRDLLALSTLPVILKTFDPRGIADSVASALTSMLDSDFVYILLPGKCDDPAIEIAWSGKRIASDSLTAIRAVLRDVARTPSSEPVVTAPNPIGEGIVRIVTAPIGFGDGALIVVGSRLTGFPTAAQRLLLGIAANEATIALQRWQAEAESSVRQTEQELRLVIDTIPAIVWRKLPDGSADFMNQRFREYRGVSAEEGLGWGWMNGIHPDDRKRFEEEWRAAFAAGEPFAKEARQRRGDGEYRRVLMRAVPRRDEHGNIVKWYGTDTDIEDQMRAEARLREQARLLDLTHDAIFVRDMHDVITYWNRGAAEFYGWSAEEVVDKATTHDLLRTAFQKPLDEINAELLSTGRWEGELKHTRANGTEAVVASRWSLQRDARGKPVGILEVNNDVTERRLAELQLRQSEAYLNEAQRLGHIGSWAQSRSSGIFYASPELLRIFGRDPDKDKLTEYLFRDSVHPEDRRFVHELVTKARSENRDFELDHRIVLPDGSIKYVHSVAHPVFGDSGELVEYIGTILDVTEQRRAEEELHKAQMDLAHVTRVTTLGELTASIAHEVNQPLAGVVSNAQACLRWLSSQPPNLDEARASLEWIISDGNRASEVIQRVRALANKAETQKGPLDINEVVNEAVTLVQRELFSHRVALRLELEPGLPSVIADRVQLQQVIINLVMNGVDAMQPVADRPRELLIRSHRDEARQLVLTVKDCGIGISAKSADHLFDAFYTTKSSGMGMGLSICRSIIAAHGGRMSAANNTGPGATFQFTLPGYRQAMS